MQRVPAVLLLEDGTAFYGKSVGKIGTTTGEICFSTGMTGYQEVFTDPSCYRQIIVLTNSHVGNYGARLSESESEGIKIAGLVCRNFSEQYHRPLAGGSVQEYFEEENLVGISDVDTRAIVRYIRSKGAMNAIISSETSDLEILKKQLDKVPGMRGLELAGAVSIEKPYLMGNRDARFKVAVVDFGLKQNILNCLVDRGCYLQVFPARTSYQEMKAWNPDGYFLSNGPGDPATMDYAVETAKLILKDNRPYFGICLGHQILAQAYGVATYKMEFGHRGGNHPVKNLLTGRSEITAQNHGFGLSMESVEAHKDEIEITHVNLNDGSVEGIRVRNKPAFSVQYHPEGSPGPHDSGYLFDDFIQLLTAGRKEQ